MGGYLRRELQDAAREIRVYTSSRISGCLTEQIRDDVRAGLYYIRYDDRVLTTIATGAVLFHFSYLSLPFIVFLGYLVYIVQETLLQLDENSNGSMTVSVRSVSSYPSTFDHIHLLSR